MSLVARVADAPTGLTLADALQYAVLVVTLLLGLGALGRALSKRINKIARDAVQVKNELRTTRERLATSNGHTIGELTEMSAQRLNELIESSNANRELAQTALKFAIRVDENLKKHEETGHSKKQADIATIKDGTE